MAALPNRLVEPMGKEAELQRKLPSGRIQCTACARLCQIGEGQIGLCGIRGVVNDRLYLLAYGKIIAGNIDPIEKKPVVHYKPGSKIFSVATTGCNWLCHPKGAKILMSDGKTKPVEELISGDLLWSYQLQNDMKTVPNVVTHVGTRLARLWEIRYGSRGHGRIFLTEEHPVWTASGWKSAGAIGPGELILKVWYQNTEKWKRNTASAISNARFNCRNCSDSVIGLDEWNRHRGECYTRGLEKSPELLRAYGQRMRENNPMKNPEVAKRAIAASKERFLIDPSHGWHRNKGRLRTWLHRQPSKGQLKLYEIIDGIGVAYEKEFEIVPDLKPPGSKGSYFADAAFPEMKLDVEVDGWWHYHNEKVRSDDKIRDQTLNANGWNVLRISGSYVFNHSEEVKVLILERLSQKVMVNKRAWLEVKSATPTQRLESVYSIESVPDHNYVADGILVHNCNYCFTPETAILTDRRIRTIETIYDESEHQNGIGYPRDLRVLSHTGFFKTVLKAFRHEYSGTILRIRPFYLPEISCTPNHEVFVFDESTVSLRKKRADELSLTDLLVVPRAKDSIVSEMIDTYQIISMAIPTIRRKSRRTSIWTLRREKERVRFGMSRGNGVPARIAVDKRLAELFGTYCAEGSSIRAKSRPNSWVVVFSFGSHERELIERTENLLYEIFQLRAGRVKQGSETRLEVYNNSLGILLHTLIGDDCYTKRVPELILHHQSTEILKSFLGAYLHGDGNSSPNGGQASMGTTSVSKELTLGTWYIMFRLGYAPRFYVSDNREEYQIEGRTVSRHNDYMTRAMVGINGLALVDRALGVAASKLVQMDDYTLVPIRSIRPDKYSGYVYNMEVEGDHSYSASFVTVSNCQNSDISQRRKVEGTDASPADVVRMATNYGCEGLAYTYNQPTIFIEYARDIGKLAREAGIFNVFVSNGYDTPESVGLMKEFLDCVTVDFKGSGETGFVRRYIGIPNAEPIFQTLLDIKKRTSIHTEITDLIVPGVGDNLDEARRLAKWVYDNLGPDTPIHFLRFHPDYKMKDIPSTPVLTLEKHYQAAKGEGLRYVYIGNVPGHPAESTYCPGCGKVLIKRLGYAIPEYNLDAKNKCRFCGYQTPIVGPLSKSVADDRFISVLY